MEWCAVSQTRFWVLLSALFPWKTNPPLHLPLSLPYPSYSNRISPAKQRLLFPHPSMIHFCKNLFPSRIWCCGVELLLMVHV